MAQSVGLEADLGAQWTQAAVGAGLALAAVAAQEAGMVRDGPPVARHRAHVVQQHVETYTVRNMTTKQLVDRESE